MTAENASFVPRFPSLPKAAELLGISPQTLREAVDRGELPVYRIRKRWLRVDWTEAVEWVHRARRAPEDGS